MQFVVAPKGHLLGWQLESGTPTYKLKKIWLRIQLSSVQIFSKHTIEPFKIWYPDPKYVGEPPANSSYKGKSYIKLM